MGWVKERGGGRVLPLSLPLLLYFGFCSIFLAAKTKNPIPPLVVPWSFFASKPHANACYAGYVGDSSPSLPKFSPRLLKRKRRNWWGKKVKVNSPHSIYKSSNVTRRLYCRISIFGLVFFVLKSLLGIARWWSHEKFSILSLGVMWGF